jgi:hypothetical protein
MFDDGNHNDAAADDGIFGGAFVPTQAGKFVAQITAKGTGLSYKKLSFFNMRISS